MEESSSSYTYDKESSCSTSTTTTTSNWLNLHHHHLTCQTTTFSSNNNNNNKPQYSPAAAKPHKAQQTAWDNNNNNNNKPQYGPAAAKPHKAQQAAWEAMRLLRRQVTRIGLHHFRILKRVGSGDIGNVYLCQIAGAPACYYAMKVVDREALVARDKLGRAEMEKEILGMIDHPFLPTLYAEFEAEHYSCLVMEFCPGGDLFALRLKQPSRRFHISSAKFYAAETLLALEYLHMMGIIYRDLKPENVLVREDGHIMLSDFDLSLKCDVVPKLLKQKKVQKYNANYSNSVENKNNSYVGRCATPSCVTPIHPVLSCFSPGNWRRRSPRVTTTTTTIRQGADGSRIESSTDNGTADDEDENENEDVSCTDAGGCNNQEFFDTEMVAEPINARSKSFVGTHEYLAPEVISGLGHGSAVDWWTFGVFLYEMLYGRTPFKGENNEKTLRNILKQPVTFPRVTLGSAKEYEEMAKVQDLICKLLVKDPKKRIGCLKGSNEIKKHEFFKGVNWALIRSVKPPLVPRELHNNNMRIRTNTNTTTSTTPTSSNSSNHHQRVLYLQKALTKKEREEPYQIPHHHFDYF